MNEIPSGITPLALPSPGGTSSSDLILYDIQKTVAKIKENTDLLTDYQKDMVDSLGGNFEALLSKMTSQFTSSEKVAKQEREYTRGWQRKQDVLNEKSQKAYLDILSKIYGANSNAVKMLMKNMEVFNRAQAMAQSRFDDYQASMNEALRGNSSEAKGGRREAIKAASKANNGFGSSLGDFAVGMAEKTSPMAAFLLQRLAGQSVAGRKEDRKAREQENKGRMVSKYFGGEEGEQDYMYHQNSLDAANKAKFQSRMKMTEILRKQPGAGGATDGPVGDTGFGAMVKQFTITGGDGSAGALSKIPSIYSVPALYIGSAIAKLGKHSEDERKSGAAGGGPIATVVSKVASLAKTLAKSIVGSGAFAKVFGKNIAQLGSMTAKIGASGAGKVAAMAAKTAGRAAIPLALVTEAIMTAKKLSDISKDKTMDKSQKTVAKGGAIGSGLGGFGGAIGGAAAGAAIGSVVPIIGTVIGGIAGGLIGGFLGNKAGEAGGKLVGKAIAKAPVPDSKPKFERGGIAKAAQPGAPVDATVHDGEVITPNSITPLYKEIAENTFNSALILKKDIVTKLTSIESLLSDMNRKSSGFPGPTTSGGIGGK